MNQEHARSLLGADQNATDTEITAAYRRLMQTVHPDVCKGPEAVRLTHQAISARNTTDHVHRYRHSLTWRRGDPDRPPRRDGRDGTKPLILQK